MLLGRICIYFIFLQGTGATLLCPIPSAIINVVNRHSFRNMRLHLPKGLTFVTVHVPVVYMAQDVLILILAMP
jgi:hypothetical protein